MVDLVHSFLLLVAMQCKILKIFRSSATLLQGSGQDLPELSQFPVLQRQGHHQQGSSSTKLKSQTYAFLDQTTQLPISKDQEMLSLVLSRTFLLTGGLC